MVKPLYSVKSFRGAVITKDVTYTLTGGGYRVFVGTVSIVQDEEAIGFKTRGTEANWIARVEGPTQAYNFPGCQVRGVISMKPNVAPPKIEPINAYVVP